MAAQRRRTPTAEQHGASMTPPDPAPIIDPPQTLDAPVLMAAADVPAAPSPAALTKRVKIRLSGPVNAGGAHYELRASDIMELPAHVADELITERYAEEI